MTKKELGQAVAKRTGITGKAAAQMVDTVIEEIVSSLENGEEVSIPGFGIFHVRTREAHQGYIPSTKTRVMIPEQKSPAFKASRTLKNIVAGRTPFDKKVKD